jgi:hypothetical protein
MLARKLALTVLLTLVATGADAQGTQGVHRRCLKAKDKVKCTCFVQNNGQIVYRSGTRRAVIRSMGELDGYVACMTRRGRPNG